MKAFALLSIAIIGLLSSVQAFPALGDPSSPQYGEFLKRAAEIKAGKGKFQNLIKRGSNFTQQTPDNGFGHRRLTALIDPDSFKYNEKEQTVDLTSDEHKFIPPGPGDIRGPCPGLNLLANHGYFNRNGVTNLAQGIDAINKVFGVEYDLALALNAYAVVFNGNILDLSWSIGGPPPASKGLGALEDILAGPPQGISAHNIYEGDASIVRQDYYAPGSNYNNYDVHLPFFKDLLALGNNDATPGKDVYSAELMLQHKANRWHESVATNPFFFQSAFGGLVVTTAAERFVAEFAANNTVDDKGYNRIYLDEPNLLAFFGVEKDSNGELHYTPGHERLLPSWKRRPLAATFGLDDIVLTLLNAANVDPSLLSLGGNTGKVNSFAGVDAGDITGGAIHTTDLLNDPQALACFLFQAGIEEVVPSYLNAIYKDTAKALDFVGQNIKRPFQSLAEAGNNPCERYNTNATSYYDKYPGSKIQKKTDNGLVGTLLGGGY
ncbi:uncharacterized protein FA14DRAFT_73355 [Meira miltonrushii]|uniref:Heme haloperoxidase family profile domain-containing protein n=1 Tax=Meira miltonrushii TaxID=1280837 RepID=A0A316V4E4_9BASI|nr:uncharacterized protein FA14DRAFT_73355 [Meira miltonrushii]PWN32429.1 hypothetical protein FA14DRAFT_73355 [Meira miltonrushii]